MEKKENMNEGGGGTMGSFLCDHFSPHMEGQPQCISPKEEEMNVYR